MENGVATQTSREWGSCSGEWRVRKRLESGQLLRRVGQLIRRVESGATVQASDEWGRRSGGWRLGQLLRRLESGAAESENIPDVFTWQVQR